MRTTLAQSSKISLPEELVGELMEEPVPMEGL